MKFCYVDESLAGSDPDVQVMVGIIVDAHRLNRTRAEFSEAIDKVNEAFPEGLKELKGSRIFYGRGGWSKVDADVRKDIIRTFCEWVVERKHRLALSAISTGEFPLDGCPVELNDLWVSGAMHIALQVQRQHQPQLKKKGHTVLIFDENKRKADALNDVLFSPPEWTDQYYSKDPIQEQLDQIVDSAFFTKSHHAGLTQVADVFAFVFRRYSEMVDFGSIEEYSGELNDISAFVEILRPKLLSRSMRWSTAPANECGSMYLQLAPQSLAEIKGEQG